LISGEQQYFVWDTAFQSPKWLYVINIWWGMGPWPRLCVNGVSKITKVALSS